jgi:hypothetical protein
MNGAVEENAGPPVAGGAPGADTPSPRHASALRLIGVICAGNEADIIEACVRHSLTLLDRLLILEHNTLDGTREILDRLVAEGLPISLEHASEPRFMQREFTNRLLRAALEIHGADWVFPLDCDEFLLAASRAALDGALTEAGDAHVRMKWVNYVPTPDDPAGEPHPLRRIRHCYDYRRCVDDNPYVWKIGVNARFLGDYYLDRYEIVRGNHFLSLLDQRPPASAPMATLTALRIAHFPVRSTDQMAQKAALGLLARLGTQSRSTHHAQAWHEVTSGGIGFATLARVARTFIDIGRVTPDALIDTPLKLAPLPAPPLSYGVHALPAAAVILKWAQRHLQDDARQRAAWRLAPFDAQGDRLPDLAALLKWIEQHLLDDAQRRDGWLQARTATP